MGALVVTGLLAIVIAVSRPFLPALDATGAILLIAAFGYGLHRLAGYAEARGWIYYRKHHGSWGAVGAALSHVHAIYEPGRIHVQQLKEEAHVYQAEDDEGEGPPPFEATSSRHESVRPAP